MVVVVSADAPETDEVEDEDDPGIVGDRSG